MFNRSSVYWVLKTSQWAGWWWEYPTGTGSADTPNWKGNILCECVIDTSHGKCLIPLKKKKQNRGTEKWKQLIKATHLEATRDSNSISLILSPEMQKRQACWETHSGRGEHTCADVTLFSVPSLSYLDFPTTPSLSPSADHSNAPEGCWDSPSPWRAESPNSRLTLDPVKTSLLKEALLCSPDLTRQQGDDWKGKIN